MKRARTGDVEDFPLVSFSETTGVIMVRPFMQWLLENATKPSSELLPALKHWTYGISEDNVDDTLKEARGAGAEWERKYGNTHKHDQKAKAKRLLGEDNCSLLSNIEHEIIEKATFDGHAFDLLLCLLCFVTDERRKLEESRKYVISECKFLMMRATADLREARGELRFSTEEEEAEFNDLKDKHPHI